MVWSGVYTKTTRRCLAKDKGLGLKRVTSFRFHELHRHGYNNRSRIKQTTETIGFKWQVNSSGLLYECPELCGLIPQPQPLTKVHFVELHHLTSSFVVESDKKNSTKA